MADSPSEITAEKKLWAEFLETTPPGQYANVEKLFSQVPVAIPSRWYISTPDIQLHCGSEFCGGLRFFGYVSERIDVNTEITQAFIKYSCRNCRKTTKLFAVVVHRSTESSEEGVALKLGEIPPFGPQVPPRVISLIGPDREIFLRGRRAENQALGICAFAYYRRVIENQKSRLITEIAKVAAKLGASPEELSVFERAAQETQFSQAVDDVKAAIPQSLLINGHNPLSLLHRALSEGLHAQSDEECLELATSIRIVLTELSERLSQALKDEAELRQAVSRLLKPRDSSTCEETAERV